jgi:retron-type reverse transcriptase
MLGRDCRPIVRMDTGAFSIEELAEAWERVRDNHGCAGVDGITVDDFDKGEEGRLAELGKRVREGTYRPLPLMKIVVEKKPGSAKMRRLLVPCVGDRILQTAAARRLSRSFEEEFLESSYAYRPGRGVDRAIARVVQWRDRGFVYAVDGAICDYRAAGAGICGPIWFFR